MGAPTANPLDGLQANPFALDIGRSRHPTLTRLPRGRHGLSREFIDLNHRNRVLLGAVSSAAERGYLATTVTDITGYASVSRNSFYRHFADKETCFLTAYDVVVDWIGEALDEALEPARSWSQQVKAAVETALGIFAADPRLARFCMFEILFVGPVALERYEATVERLAAPLRAGRAEHHGGEELPGILEPTLIGGAISLIASNVKAGRGERLAELAPELAEYLLAPYLGTEEARRVAAGDTLAESR